MFKKGDQIGPYTLIDKLGAGSFAEVWLAEHRILKEQQAVKLTTNRQITKEHIVKEAQLWRRAVPHENIVPILDANEYDSLVVIATEFHPDGSLHAWLEKHGKASTYVAINMILGILNGLDHLHTRQDSILHRDLKPANILLQGEKARIADFGLARLVDETWSGFTLGTFHYMAPECFGHQGARSVQTDIWSVGVIFYRLVAGRLPFPQDEQAALIGAILKIDAPPLPDSVPRSLQEVIFMALQKDPKQRYKSASEMRAALQEAAKEIKSADDHFNSGCDHFEKEEYGLAIDSFDRAIELNPEYTAAYRKRGEAFFQRGLLTADGQDHDRAIEDLTQAIKLRPDTPGAYYWRAMVYMEKAQHDLAIADLNQSILLKPDNHMYYKGRAKAYCRKDEYDRAISDCNRAIELKPDHAPSYHWRGLVYKEVSKVARANAMSDFKKFLEVGGDEVQGDDEVQSAIQKHLQELEGGELQKIHQYPKANSSLVNRTGCFVVLLFITPIVLLGLFIQEEREVRIAAEQSAQTADSLRQIAEQRVQQDLQEHLAVEQALREGKVVWWVAKVHNYTDRAITYQFRNLKGSWEEAHTVEPGKGWIHWKQLNISVRFDYSPADGYQERVYTLSSKAVINHSPNDSEKEQAPYNYFRFKNGELELSQ